MLNCFEANTADFSYEALLNCCGTKSKDNAFLASKYFLNVPQDPVSSSCKAHTAKLGIQVGATSTVTRHYLIKNEVRVFKSVSCANGDIFKTSLLPPLGSVINVNESKKHRVCIRPRPSI